MQGLDNEYIPYTISNHAKERYAQRIMSRDNITDIRKFVSDHDNDIEKWINEMIEHGESIYTGPLLKNNYVEVFLNGLWVVITGPTKKVVVTLYKIDLGDDEVNDLFVKKMKKKIEDSHKDVEAAETSSSELVSSYQDIIDRNTEDIAYMKNEIRSLEEINEAYETLKNNALMGLYDEKRKLRRLVEQLIYKQEF